MVLSHVYLRLVAGHHRIRSVLLPELDLSRVIRRASPSQPQNLGILFRRLNSGAIILLGLLVAFSIVQGELTINWQDPTSPHSALSR